MISTSIQRLIIIHPFPKHHRTPSDVYSSEMGDTFLITQCAVKFRAILIPVGLRVN